MYQKLPIFCCPCASSKTFISGLNWILILSLRLRGTKPLKPNVLSFLHKSSTRAIIPYFTFRRFRLIHVRYTRKPKTVIINNSYTLSISLSLVLMQVDFSNFTLWILKYFNGTYCAVIRVVCAVTLKRAHRHIIIF